MYFEILFLFIFIIFILGLLSGLGSIVLCKFSQNFILNIFFGFIILGLYSTSLHFFAPINFLSIFIIILIGSILFLNKVKNNLKTIFNKSNLIFVLIIILLIPILLTQKYHEDFGYYHLPYAISFIEKKIIFGFANINYAYIYNSIWLNISSLFFLENLNYNFLTFHSFILYISFVIYLFNNIRNIECYSLSNAFSILVLFYFLLKFTRISEYGVDLPAAIYSLLAIINFLKFFETRKEDKRNFYFFCNLSFSVFAILIKLSTIPVILFTLYLFFRFYFLRNIFYLKKNFIIIYLCFIAFFIQQYIYTGCLIFPSNLTCLDVSWFNIDFSTYKNKLELINKSYANAKNTVPVELYLDNFRWFPFWIKRNYIEILEHVSTMILPLLFFLFICPKKYSQFKSNKKVLIIFTIIFFINLIFWFTFSPVYRFAIHLFLILSFLLVLFFFYKKKFSKKIFLLFFSLFLFFNFSKNVNRVLKNDEFFIGIKKINNDFIVLQNFEMIDLNIYTPNNGKNAKNGWQGRLCWDIPFVCGYQKINAKLKYNYLFFEKFND